ncbi:MAG TPA: helix-turn-helix transcriptional regulator, partial [Dyadobacter sp.]|nr:helix-turn-helix transcriptional regulator [Dyadobacter sp.]
ISNLVRLREDLKKRYQQALLPDHSDIDANGITAKSIADDVNAAFVNKLKGIVIDNMSNAEFGVNDMALHMGMSVSVLYKKMRSLTGTTVNDFVKTYRLHEAKKLLESGVYQVNEVSTIVGFDDSKYFSKEFRKAFGKTPMEIKKNGFQQLG